MSTTKAEVRFQFNRNDDTPQIPRMQDVLYVLNLSEAQEFFNIFRQREKRTNYMHNLVMVTEKIGTEVKALWSPDPEEARRLIARTIVDLCPEEAKCLYREAYILAKRQAGDNVPGPKAGPDEIMYACRCSHCQDEKYQRALSTD